MTEEKTLLQKLQNMTDKELALWLCKYKYPGYDQALDIDRARFDRTLKMLRSKDD